MFFYEALIVLVYHVNKNVSHAFYFLQNMFSLKIPNEHAIDTCIHTDVQMFWGYIHFLIVLRKNVHLEWGKWKTLFATLSFLHVFKSWKLYVANIII